MSKTLFLPFPECLSLIRRELGAEGLETASEWDAALDLRDTMGPQVAEKRCLFVFDPVALLHGCQAEKPASALATVTLQSHGLCTSVAVSGHGPSYQKACRAIARCTQQLPPLRHAA